MTFLEKYELLKKSVPVPAVINRENVECEYVDLVDYSKNCYYCFDSAKLIDGIYTTLGLLSNKLVDCTAITESEKCYICVDCNKCYNCSFLLEANDCTDCNFSIFLNSCTDCFGCVALTHKKYCIYNKQYTKKEYFNKIEELNKEKPEKILSKMFELKQQIPHPASTQVNSEGCPYGDEIDNSKNSYWCFNTYYIDNSGYIYLCSNIKNCWDTFFTGGADGKSPSERSYELVDSGICYNSAFLHYCDVCTDCYYGAGLLNCSDCFGCVGLTKKKYCILNNQLTKDKYEKTVREIKKKLGWKI